MFRICTRCGEQFECQAQNQGKSCWCFDLPKVSNLPTQYKDCLCRECLRQFLDGRPRMGSLIEGEDYYYDQNKMVFTREYHLRRGACCSSGCRHCPYKKGV